MPSPRQHIGSGRSVTLLARGATALLGGYAATAALASLGARLLPGDRAEATVWAMIASPLLYVTIALWCFHTPHLSRVLLAIWGSALIGGSVLWLLGTRP